MFLPQENRMTHPSPTRRRFIGQVVIAGSAACGCRVYAQGGAHVDEADEQAIALGYKNDTATVDSKKCPKHASSQHCGNCSFWQGKPDDTWAGCAMFGRKQVANQAWCQVWAKGPA
jgi:High potential iron-sulfur protein